MISNTHHSIPAVQQKSTRSSRYAAVALLALFGAGTASLTHAASMSSQTYSAAKKDLDAVYKAERDTCSPMSGNAKDICVETAKGREKVAMAHLQAQRTGSSSDVAKLQKARYEARYEVAKERCDDQTGDQKDICRTAAKTEHDKAKASAQAAKDIADARDDEEGTRMKADYKLASEKCGTLSGDAKDSCNASARARFGQ